MLNQPAPDFTLYNTQKQTTTLSSLKGKKVVLLFIPAAFSDTCTREFCQVRDEYFVYDELKAEVFGISTDSVWSLIAYKKEQNLNFELLSDYNREVCRMYDVLHEEFAFGMKGVAKRAAFVIDKDGIVRYSELVTVRDTLPDFGKIRQVLSAI
jgi:glutaredoxin-dependent peroxiredoxin